ncbi:hypothetical protein QTN89_28605 [Roseiconus lacunae]|uniref:Uncharacterized protein n=1 Tax=Roseiconus lacunae TaxID=2605694 RepID=A0ABT7PSW2_9BACT|nr:hypothetical protein [Roseiconus lacunae]MDM4019448.1 hypothetical protein [Roseiconus lacunae]
MINAEVFPDIASLRPGHDQPVSIRASLMANRDRAVHVLRIPVNLVECLELGLVRVFVVLFFGIRWKIVPSFGVWERFREYTYEAVVFFPMFLAEIVVHFTKFEHAVKWPRPTVSDFRHETPIIFRQLDVVFRLKLRDDGSIYTSVQFEFVRIGAEHLRLCKAATFKGVSD